MAQQRSPKNPPQEPLPSRAKLFRNGRSQAVRLPKAYRFEGHEVSIRKQGEAVVLEPIVRRGWPSGYWQRLSRLTADLDLGTLEPLGGSLAVPSLEDE